MYNNVRAELARKNKSVADLSKETGIRYQTLAHKINGDASLTISEAVKVKKALRVDIPFEELFAET